MTRYRFETSNRPHVLTRTAEQGCRTLLEERFPHVLTAIQAMWGYPELDAYFHKLTMNERDRRQGFPPEVWDDIHLLWLIHQTIMPSSLSLTSPGVSCA